MNEGVKALSERERETLRLLLAGHDAKSIARLLDLSVHTINERLRDARRKLGVASSREAARRLAEAGLKGSEIPLAHRTAIPRAGAPQIVVPDEIGEAASAGGAATPASSDRHGRSARALAWFGGGMLMMSLMIAAAVVLPGWPAMQRSPGDTPAAVAQAPAPAPALAQQVARNWVALLDAERWKESWSAAAVLFRSSVTAESWASTVLPLRRSLGTVSARRVRTARRTSSLPGLPDGDYAIVEFTTAFARKAGAVETVALVHEADGWKVNGYFIR